ncbi:antitoxin [bacterium]|nr:antitoxin [bacterium]
MKTITVRGIDDALAEALKSIAEREKESMNKTILRLLEQGAGVSGKVTFPTHDDLDALAGTWSKEQADAFMRNTQQFSRIDEEMWNAQDID